MEKKKLRKDMLALMKEQVGKVKRRRDQALLFKLTSLPAYESATTIATYLSTALEFNTLPFIQQALADGKRVVVPKVLPDRQMVFLDYGADNIQLSSFGVPEPISGEVVDKAAIDLIHVPGLAWNEDGFRVGYGGGFYDRYLVDFQGQTVSTIYPFQVQDFTQDSFDIAVQQVLVAEKEA
ncbi:5-formyltetrahydrofolate cyclo-ligase [Streptococcus gallolyticus]|nr:5-formyltetrahydrofolate cyclo-ligase [Streptococcus gallolyticus]MBY5041515.1 5-formyltetrahydrofolate cyclo-ligase [Streptococcus gallolyticus]